MNDNERLEEHMNARFLNVANRDIERLRLERDEARRFAEEAASKYNELLAEGRVLRCAFCGEAYPPDTPPSQHEALTAHIRVCAKHPMRQLEQVASAALHALRSYQFGNAAPELAENCANALEQVLKGVK